MVCTHFHLLLILGFLFYGSASAAEATNKGCKKVLYFVADKQSKFVDCMVRTSVPAESCVNCLGDYSDMTSSYAKLISNCSKEILDINRLNIVYNMQKDLLDVWNKGFCNDCFENGIISNQTDKFGNYSKSFEKCLFNTHDKICQVCGPLYGDLNRFYKEMDEEKKGQICFDTQDKMNRTRSHWSKDLKCCHREYNFTFFFIASSLFAALPIVFYFGMYGYTKRMERNHEVLDADLNTGNATTSTGVQSGTTSHIEERTSQRDSSSDEECIDNLKKQKKTDIISKENSVHPEEAKTLKETLKPISSARPTSSNEIGTLIEL